MKHSICVKVLWSCKTDRVKAAIAIIEVEVLRVAGIITLGST
jgi:hypothetical protein